jgi:23S rRNA pseudouridine1911/1915/1917 synthase
VVYADGELVVVDKPPGISTTAYSEERDCLDRLVRELLQNRAPKGVRVGPLGVVHRLDKDTSGLIAFARTMRAKLHLKQQFRSRTTERAYFAIATGRVSSSTLSSRLVADRGDGLRGSTSNPKLGRLAVTHVRTLATNPQATFVKCKLETGRTHQIRIQLFEAGHPLAGERVYTRRLHAPPRARSCVPAPRVMLHAAELGIIHPASLKPLRFTSPLPADMQKLLKELGLFVPPGTLAPNPPG